MDMRRIGRLGNVLQLKSATQQMMIEVLLPVTQKKILERIKK